MEISRRRVMSLAAAGIALAGVSTGAGVGTTLAHAVENENLGVAITTVRVTASALGTWTDGRSVLFAVGGQSDQPVRFAVIDIATGGLLASHLIGNSYNCYDVKVDGNQVFLASWSGGHLHRYDVSTDQIVDLGVPLAGQTTLTRTVISGDTVYGGTYPGGRVFAYSRSTGNVTDLGRVDATEEYARSLALDGTNLYVGTEAHAKLYRINLTTGVKTLVPMPPAASGEIRIYDMAIRNGLLFAYTSPTLTWWVYDLTTGQWIDNMPNNTQGGITEADSAGRVYFVNLTAKCLYAYDTVARSFTSTPWESTVGSAGTHLRTGTSEHVIGISSDGRLSVYAPSSNIGTVTQTEFPPIGVTIRSLGLGPAGRILVGGSIGSTTYGEWSTATQQFNNFSGGPGSRIDVFATVQGKIYFSHYGAGAVYEYDPSQPYVGIQGTIQNPKPLFSLIDAYEQERIFALIPYGTNELLVGSSGTRGMINGRMLRYNVSTGALSDLGNPLEGHSVVSLTMAGSSVVGGTSIQVLGATSPEPSAKVFIADPVTGAVSWQGVPDPAAASICELVTLANGMVWGLTSAGNMFEFHPTTHAFGSLTKVGAAGGSWGMGTVAASGNLLYGATSAGTVFGFYPPSRVPFSLGSGEHAVVGPDGLYWADNSELIRRPLANSHGPANGGFEASSGTTIPNWTIKYGNTTNFEVVTAHAASGTKSLKIANPTGVSIGLLSDRLAAAPGPHQLRATIFSESGKMSVYVYFYDAAGVQIYQTYELFNVPAGTSATVQMAVVAPAGTTQTAVLLYSPASAYGTRWVDNVIMLAE